MQIIKLRHAQTDRGADSPVEPRTRRNCEAAYFCNFCAILNPLGRYLSSESSAIMHPRPIASRAKNPHGRRCRSTRVRRCEDEVGEAKFFVQFGAVPLHFALGLPKREIRRGRHDGYYRRTVMINTGE